MTPAEREIKRRPLETVALLRKIIAGCQEMEAIRLPPISSRLVSSPPWRLWMTRNRTKMLNGFSTILMLENCHATWTPWVYKPSSIEDRHDFTSASRWQFHS